ncbi:MAG: tetraacyldisaccharide 4'-kinase [Rickettsiaceae bacterium]|nr:tetraacyldisaccharide 4'-kinase [Rickettsiaceae bacterium]
MFSWFSYPKFWQTSNLLNFTLYPFCLIFYILGIIRKISTSQIKLAYPIICIGNASVGGCGKTRLIKALAHYYNAQQKRVIIVSKGYGSKLSGAVIVDSTIDDPLLVGDESIELATNFFGYKNILVIASRSPILAHNIIKKFAPDIILVDDGLQNPSFYKDFTILMIDGLRGFGNGLLIPAGPLRETKKSALENDVLISLNPTDKILQEFSHLPKFYAIETNITLDAKDNSPALAFCGIGNPDNFFNMLKSKVLLIDWVVFPDHYSYKESDLEYIVKQADIANAKVILTTEKDMSKITRLKNYDKRIISVKNSIDLNPLEPIIEKINERIFPKP